MPLPHPLGTLLALALAATALPVFAAPSSPPPEPWPLLRDRLFSDALPAFNQALRSQPDSPALALGRAVTLLNRQPRTRDNVAVADAALAELEGQSGDLGLQARYLRARVAEVHLFEPDFPLAARRYEELIAAAPGHPLSQMAVAKLVRLRVYDLTEDPLGELRASERWAEMLTLASARRDFHLVMARSYQFFGATPERALSHLIAARDAGQAIPAQAAATLVSIGELARELGEAEVARDAYATFLENHPRDQRVYMIRQRIAQLDAAAALASDRR